MREKVPPFDSNGSIQNRMGIERKTENRWMEHNCCRRMRMTTPAVGINSIDCALMIVCVRNKSNGR